MLQDRGVLLYISVSFFGWKLFAFDSQETQLNVMPDVRNNS